MRKLPAKCRCAEVSLNPASTWGILNPAGTWGDGILVVFSGGFLVVFA